MNILAVHPFEKRTMLLHVTSTRSAQLLMTMFSAVILCCVYSTASLGRAPVTGVGQWLVAGRRRRCRSEVNCTALLHCATLNCIALHCTALQLCRVLVHCTVMCCTQLYSPSHCTGCTVLCCTLLYTFTLHWLHRAAISWPALFCPG